MAGKKSGAEYQRAYVERIKTDPQQHEEYKKRRAAQDREGRKRRKENASDAELEQRRTYERERKRLQREKKAKLLKVQIFTPDNKSKGMVIILLSGSARDSRCEFKSYLRHCMQWDFFNFRSQTVRHVTVGWKSNGKNKKKSSHESKKASLCC